MHRSLSPLVAALLLAPALALAAATPAPSLRSADADDALTTLFLKGDSLGTVAPDVQVGGKAARVLSYSPTDVVVQLPAGATSATYLIRYTRKPDNAVVSFEATLGAAGATGPAGPSGPAGPVGPQGPQGFMGPAGPAGADGAAGAPGEPGATGPQGAAGPQGVAGPQGPQGPAGPQGSAGTSFHYAGTWAYATTYQTGDVVEYLGTSYVSLTDGNTARAPSLYAPVLWGVVAQAGATGATGATGAMGATGPAGPAGKDGPVGPMGPSGPQGPAGGGVKAVYAGRGLMGGVYDTEGTLSIAPGGVTNDLLANTSIPLVLGPGLTGSPTLTLGQLAYLENSGVTSLRVYPSQWGVITTPPKTGAITLESTGGVVLDETSQGARIRAELQGDVRGSGDATRVTGLAGAPLAPELPAPGAVLTFDPYLMAWAPRPTVTGLQIQSGWGWGYVTGNVTLHAEGGVVIAPIGINELRIATELNGDVQGSGDLNRVRALAGFPLSQEPPMPGAVLTFDAAANAWAPRGGVSPVPVAPVRSPMDLATGRWRAGPSGRFQVTNAPGGVAFDGEHLWFTTADGVAKVRARDGAVAGSFTVGEQPRAVVFDGSFLWVLDNRSVAHQLDPADGTQRRAIELGYSWEGCTTLAFDGESLWSSCVTGRVVVFRTTDGSSYPWGAIYAGPFQSVALDGEYAWLLSEGWYGTGTLAQYRISDLSLVTTLSVPAPTSLAVDGVSAWVGTAYGTVERYEASTGRLVSSFSTGDYGASIDAVLWDGRTLWAGDGYGARLVGFDPAAGAVRQRFQLEYSSAPRRLAFDGSRVWSLGWDGFASRF